MWHARYDKIYYIPQPTYSTLGSFSEITNYPIRFLQIYESYTFDRAMRDPGVNSRGFRMYVSCVGVVWQ